MPAILPLAVDNLAEIEIAPFDQVSLSLAPDVAVDGDADTLSLGVDHGLENGDAIRFASASTIGGIEAGSFYFVSIDESDPARIRLHETSDDALTGARPVDLGV